LGSCCNQRTKGFFMQKIMSKQIIFSDEDNSHLRTYLNSKGDIRIEVGNLFTDSIMDVECISLSIEDAKDLIEVLQSEIDLSEQ
jgi:hypothetical protein